MNIPYGISKSALQTHQHKLDNVAHNISNVNTTGFKKKDVQFSELMHNAVTEQDVRLSENAEPLSLNAGVRIAGSKDSHTQGSLTHTGDTYHLAIGGNGFFGVRNADNERLLTRDGAFHLSDTNQLVNDRGDMLDVNLTIPADEWAGGTVSIGKNGDISSVVNGESTVVGSIPLFLPANSSDIESAGGNMYRVADDADLLIANADQGGVGTIMSGYLEESNVDLAQSMTDMMMSQRAYSLNSKVMQSTDEIYSLINQFT